MIDLLIVSGCLGTHQDHHLKRITQISFARFNDYFSKPTITFINLPITGAQVEVKCWVELVADIPRTFVQISIPLPAVTIGQNYAHAGLEVLKNELDCASLIVKLTLLTLGFNEAEIALFMESSSPKMVELTWNTPTSSEDALKNLQQRTFHALELVKKASRRHDSQIRDLDYRKKNFAPAVLASLKNGDQFRQYGKFDQIAAKSNRGKTRYKVSAEMARQKDQLLDAIRFHARNEVRLGFETLKSLGMAHPKNWTAEGLKTGIDGVWHHLGFAVKPRLDRSQLSPEALTSLDQFDVGVDLVAALPAHTFSRHRKSILAANGPDIAIPWRHGQVNPESVGYQLQYERRWKPTKFQKLVISAATAPAIETDLQRGIAFIRDGELPDIADSDELERWMTRWKAFMAKERLLMG
ncbi:hypothetical protein hmeg3_09610 [Herbaspirillum sp. meg3]|uniref:hypothetical protein n=1 Tax=Herbaspirillum sp. meg3 TaxID=2025949 RepID=UPI000B97D127|nr:hypothetical protein [Herbaspirillum sp. meg3]ASU38527.1 hypothetical protein hmeg3_09610 [Herbaspirillum sp. meg3]